jgi:mannitol/fructose-specific phosphotransferase system IIA component (Ntr-type)
VVLRFLILLVLAGTAPAAERWIAFRSGPFEVYTNASDKAARPLLLRFEEFRHALGEMVGETDLETPMPVRILCGEDVLREVVEMAQPSDMMIMGCPNDLLIHNGFKESLAGRLLRRFAGTVLLRLPGQQSGTAPRLTDVFWEATIVSDLEAPNKWEAIGRLLEALTRAGQVPRERHGQILRAIQMRELDGSTLVGGGIAMPHAAIDDFSGLVGCLGVSRQGICYEEGEEPVHFVFLLVSSSRDYAKYHAIQAAIARFMTKKADQYRREMLRCQTPAEVARLLGAEGRDAEEELTIAG